MQRKNSLRLGVLILVTGTILGLIIASGFEFTEPTQSSPPFQPQPNVILGSQESVPESLLKLQNTSEAFVYIAESVVPTVVTVRSTRFISAAEMERYHDEEDLRDFFRFRIPKEFRQYGAGSGIIVSKEGYILTNVHVVDKSEKVRVILPDNREFDADIIGLDPLTEVAVIKIDADNLAVARLGDSDDTRVGQWVLAVGNPLELRSTVTAGIISAKERQIDIIRGTFGVENFIQTDAAINPGNSGGALVNLSGEVIGVNTAIATETGYNAGFGFAIPINLAKKIMDDIIHKGRVERGYLGIAMVNIDENKAKALGMDHPSGVFVDRVLRNSPAERADIRPKDVILKIDSEEVNRSNQIQAMIARRSPGEVVCLVVLRGGREIELEVTLGLKETQTNTLSDNKRPSEFEDIGLTVENLSLDKAERLDYAGRSGALVTKVERWSPAYEAGIIEDDIIAEIGDQDVKNSNDFYRILSGIEKGSVTIFKIVRRKEQFHVFIRIP
ncbi:Do family serine endopeptidase [candidate division KSB1 bacterium]|nr:Do family serine endopeptidase [candidate division KSB1 bacterium]NIR71492.1 Do family serine endopeptidase [candidate division KSB1 bacterium]NIS23413.1 Do family serine endopeptidase [candidate division KSB1 bacterium]NIT70304.1 Do family serine endopeptidase [candidate division KSB1 bacterium]NIU24027.1 Do family serine endopeptidase [candidate division KSB1 bacterium]